MGDEFLRLGMFAMLNVAASACENGHRNENGSP